MDDEDEDEYTMNGQRRGRFVIFCQENFSPALSEQTTARLEYAHVKDADIVKEIFTNLGFEVETYLDKTVTGIRDILSNLNNFKEECIFGMIVISHGGANGLIYASDGPMYVQEFINLIASKPGLANKPKVFFVDSRRGTKMMGTHTNETTPSKEDEEDVVEMTLPPHWLLVNSTVEGYTSFHNKEGSWFLQALNEAFKKYRKKDIITILQRTNNILADRRSQNKDSEPSNKCQIASIKSMLLKELYLKPP